MNKRANKDSTLPSTPSHTFKLTPTQIIRMCPSFTILQDQLHAGADWHCYLGASGTGAAPPGHVGGRYVGRWRPPWPLSSRSSGAGPYLPLRRISSCPPPPLTGGRFMVCHPPEREPVRPWLHVTDSSLPAVPAEKNCGKVMRIRV